MLLAQNAAKIANRTDTRYFTQISGLSMHFLPNFNKNLIPQAKVKSRKVRALKNWLQDSNDKLEFRYYSLTTNSNPQKIP